MLGLNGVVVKSHGGTDAEGFAHAVDVAMDMVVHRFNERIREDLAPNRRIDGAGCEARARRRQGSRRRRAPRHGADRVDDAHPLHPRRRRRLSARARGQQRRTRPHRGDLRRVDPRAHRHPPAPHRGAARDRRPSWAPRRRAPRWRDAGAGAERGGRDHPGHQHAGPGVPRHRAARAGGSRRDAAASASTSPRPAPASSTRCRWPTA